MGRAAGRLGASTPPAHESLERRQWSADFARALLSFFQGRDENRHGHAIFGATGGGLHGDQRRQVEHTQPHIAVRELFGVRQKLVVAARLGDLAQHVEASHAGLHVQVSVAGQVALARGQAALREVRMEVRAKLVQHVEQLADVLGRAPMHDVEVERRDRRPMQHARRAAGHDELDARAAQDFEQLGDLLRWDCHLRNAARRTQAGRHCIKVIRKLHRAMQPFHRR